MKVDFWKIALRATKCKKDDDGKISQDENIFQYNYRQIPYFHI